MTIGPGDFFERAYEVFLTARAKAEVACRGSYRIGGMAARLEIAGVEMQSRLERAVRHLQSENEEESQLTICAWDSAASRTPMITPSWSEADYGARGEVRAFNDARFRTAFDHGSDALSMVDHERRIALFWTRDATRLPLYESGAPFRTILSWCAERNGGVLMHCGAVSNDSGGVLLAGAGGSGKSTSTLLCLKAGWNYLGDDYCVVQPSPQPQVFSLYNSAKLTRDSAERFSLEAVLPPAHHLDQMKELFFLSDTPGLRLAGSAVCRLLLLPCVTTQAQTTVEAASPGEALRAVAPSSIFQLSGAGAMAFERLTQLVRILPVMRLKLGSDFARIPDVIARCLAHI